MNSPVISVIMSVHNREDYVKDSILSVLNQSFSDFEFIIVDDASTDNTLKILKSFDDPRITIIENKTNVGLTKNLNRALSIAEGKYIARMDDDDICFPNRFELQVAYLEKHKDVFMVCSEAVLFGAEQKLMFANPNNYKFYKGFLVLRNTVCHSSVMFRNDGSRYDEEYLKSQDFEFWFRVVNIENKKIGHINKPLMYLRIHNAQTNTTTQLQYASNILERNYRHLFGDNYDQGVFDTHNKLVLYDPKIVDNPQDLADLYNYHKKQLFKEYKYLRPALLFEITKYCSRNNLPNPLKKKFLLSCLIPTCLRYYSVIILTSKKNTEKYINNINWFID